MTELFMWLADRLLGPAIDRLAQRIADLGLCYLANALRAEGEVTAAQVGKPRPRAVARGCRRAMREALQGRVRTGDRHLLATEVGPGARCAGRYRFAPGGVTCASRAEATASRTSEKGSGVGIHGAPELSVGPPPAARSGCRSRREALSI